MASTRKNPFIGSRVTEHISAQRAKDPELRAMMDAELARYEVADRLRALRQQKKMTQAEFAKLVGIKQSFLARLESGRQLPTVRTLQQIAQAAGKKLDVRFVPSSGGRH